MPVVAFLGAVELGLIYGLVALGLFLTFRVLDVSDLTVAGTFPLGAAIAATAIAMDLDPWLASGAGAGAGALAGLVTAFVGVRFRLPHLLVSIFAMMALLASGPRIVALGAGGGGNDATVFALVYGHGLAPYMARPLALFVFALVVAGLVALFLRTDLGLAMRVAGANSAMARTQAVHVGAQIVAGVAISNAIVAFAGALLVQIDRSAGLSAGVETFVIGLAAMLVGEAMLPRRGVFLAAGGCLLGGLVYELAAGLLLRIDALRLTPPDLTLVTALGVAATLALPWFRRWRTSS